MIGLGMLKNMSEDFDIHEVHGLIKGLKHCKQLLKHLCVCDKSGGWLDSEIGTILPQHPCCSLSKWPFTSYACTRARRLVGARRYLSRQRFVWGDVTADFVRRFGLSVSTFSHTENDRPDAARTTAS